MLQKLLLNILFIATLSFPYVYSLGNDMTALDDFHFKNWSYVYMKEFEAGNYSKLYVTAQPGVLTLYTNIIGFKGLYFAKDKLDLVTATGKDFDLLLNTAQKIPKVALVLVLMLAIFGVLYTYVSARVAYIFTTLLALEPLVIAHARVIQTDILPMLLGLLTLLVLYVHRTHGKQINPAIFMLLGLLTGLSVLEKSLYFVLFLLVCAELALNSLRSKNPRQVVGEAGIYGATFVITLVAIFPAFWGDFVFTLYRLTVGSFVFGIQGLDTETFSYEKTHHIQSQMYYFRFLLNKLSEFVWLGVIMFLIRLKKTGQTRLNRHTLLFAVFPLAMFIVLAIAEKKIGRYTLALFPYIILAAAVGYNKLIASNKLLSVLAVVFVMFRFCQFLPIFPDYLMYTNPLSPDVRYNNIEESWGSGRKKVAKYIAATYGSNLRVYASDYTSLYLFYEGEVLNKDELTCTTQFDLLVTTSAEEQLCGKPLVPKDSYEVYPNMVFYMYTAN